MDETKTAALYQLRVRTAGLSAMRKGMRESAERTRSDDDPGRSEETEHIAVAVADYLELLIRDMHRAWTLGATKSEIADAVDMTERQVEAQLE
jgi:hypothetical protein